LLEAGPVEDEQLDRLTRNGDECSRVRSEPTAVKEAAWQTPINPWHRIHIDYAEVDGKVFLVIVEATSKWPEMFEMKTSTAAATIDVLRGVFARFGHPFEIVSDNGPQFTSAEFQSFLSRSGIRHQMGAPFNPKTNGLAERMVRSAKESMEKMKNQPGSFYVKLQRFLLSYRNTAHAKTGRSQAVVMFGRSLRTRLDLLLPVPRATPEKAVPAKFHVGQSVLARPRESKRLNYRPRETYWNVSVPCSSWKRCLDQTPRRSTAPWCTAENYRLRPLPYLLLLNHITHHQKL